MLRNVRNNRPPRLAAYLIPDVESSAEGLETHRVRSFGEVHPLDDLAVPAIEQRDGAVLARRNQLKNGGVFVVADVTSRSRQLAFEPSELA